MDKLKTNVLVIGRTGVGKSSLLNYLFGKELQETGTGRPVTKMGLFPFEYEYDDKLSIHIYDTWGLEPNKADKWEKLIIDEVREHDKKDVKEWFNTILFCVSAIADRIEDFEKEIINKLINSGNQVTVVVTNCANDQDEKFQKRKQELFQYTRVKERQVVSVCNVNKILPNKSVKQFGREQVFDAIIFNLWESLKVKVPRNVMNKLNIRINSKKQEISRMISKERFVFHRRESLDEFKDKVNAEMRTFLQNIVKECNREFIEIIDYYNQLSMKYAQIGLLDENKLLNSKEIDFNPLSIMEEEVDKWVNALKGNIQQIFDVIHRDFDSQVLKDLGVAMKRQFSSARELKKSMNKANEEYMDNIKDTLYKHILSITKELKLIDYDGVRSKMIE